MEMNSVRVSIVKEKSVHIGSIVVNISSAELSRCISIQFFLSRIDALRQTVLHYGLIHKGVLNGGSPLKTLGDTWTTGKILHFYCVGGLQILREFVSIPKAISQSFLMSRLIADTFWQQIAACRFRLTNKLAKVTLLSFLYRKRTLLCKIVSLENIWKTYETNIWHVNLSGEVR